MNGNNLLIQKYGGSSISNSDRVKKAARQIAKRVKEGNRLIVVLSAQGDTTDRLIGLALELNSTPPPREMDMLLATGEQVSIALMTMTLAGLGIKAVSQTGWQIGIETTMKFNSASVLTINADRINQLFLDHDVIVVAGFQGVGGDREITTLGRGGSDTTALALAASLNAPGCEIFTDVTGVYSADPRHVENARKLEDISYDEMLELATEGARVMDGRAVSFAKRFGISIHVRSCFSEESGTIIRKETTVEKRVVRGVSYKKDISKVTLVSVPKTSGVLHGIFEIIASNGINVDAIMQSDTTKNTTDVSFTLKKEDLLSVVKVLQAAARKFGVADVQYDVDCAKVSIVGEGMKGRPGIAATLFEALSERDIDIHMISTSDVNISVIIDMDSVTLAVAAIHEKFELGLEPSQKEG